MKQLNELFFLKTHLQKQLNASREESKIGFLSVFSKPKFLLYRVLTWHLFSKLLSLSSFMSKIFLNFTHSSINVCICFLLILRTFRQFLRVSGSNVLCKKRENLKTYPNATSKIIIKLNPAAKKIVPIFECFPTAISGINSSTTT